jgi:alkylmercury lyase
MTGRAVRHGDPDPAELEAELLATGFRLLLAGGQPVAADQLAATLGRDPASVDAAVRRLERAGRLRLNAAGRLTGSHGLSVALTRHELLLDGRRYWTWCAWDAVGILGALSANGLVHSHSPLSGAAIGLVFEEGRPPACDVVVFIADRRPCASVIDEWCPLVNFFEHADAAATWAVQHETTGTAVRLEDASATATAEWRAWLREGD